MQILMLFVIETVYSVSKISQYWHLENTYESEKGNEMKDFFTYLRKPMPAQWPPHTSRKLYFEIQLTSWLGGRCRNSKEPLVWNVNAPSYSSLKAGPAGLVWSNLNVSALDRICLLENKIFTIYSKTLSSINKTHPAV